MTTTPRPRLVTIIGSKTDRSGNRYFRMHLDNRRGERLTVNVHSVGNAEQTLYRAFGVRYYELPFPMVLNLDFGQREVLGVKADMQEPFDDAKGLARIRAFMSRRVVKGKPAND